MQRTTRWTVAIAGLALAAACAPAADDGAGDAEDSAAAPAQEGMGQSASAAPDTRPADGETPPENSMEMNAIDIAEWDVPWEGRPRDPFTQDGQTVFFVGQATSYVGRLDVASGAFDRFVLDEEVRPHNQIMDADGNVWFAGNRDAHIGYLNVETGEIEEIPTPEDTARDPHTLIWDGNGDIWFSSQGANSIGFLDVDAREVTILPVEAERARPYGVKLAPNGHVWVTLFGTNALAEVDPDTMTITEHRLPRDEARPRRLAITSDGRIWYGDYAGGYIGVFDPEAGEVTGEWEMPNGENSRPYAVEVDGSDRIWLVETGVDPNYFVGFDTAAEEFFSITAVPSGGGVIRHMQYLPETGDIWFGADMGTIGRADVE